MIGKLELPAIYATGMLRGGIAGETYFTDRPYINAATAQAELALKARPDYQVSFRMSQPVRFDRYNSPVPAAYNQPGGGIEYSTRDKVHIDLGNIHVTPLE